MRDEGADASGDVLKMIPEYLPAEGELKR